TTYATPAYELSGLDDRLLRMLPGDVATIPGPPVNTTAFGDARRLFEARTQTDLVSQGGTNSIDYYTRNRLISKIAGNTTPRSNVFIVWISVGFFEAFQPNPAGAPNVVRVGAELLDSTGKAFPHRRGFFI